MPLGNDYTSFIVDDENKIKDFIAKVSTEMFDYINDRKSSKFIMFYKYITHSDLATFGKATHPNSHKKNLLYYIDVNEMLNIESMTGKPFQTAHQSCIGLKEKLYDLVGLPQPRETEKYLINDYMNVFVLNESLKYFSSEYTMKIFDKLGKEINQRSRMSWRFENLDIIKNQGMLTPIELHCAVHGLGTALDSDFHKLRHHIFKGDTFILLFEINNMQKNMFVILEKNPVFYSLIGESNKAYTDYQKLLRERLINRIKGKSNVVNMDDIIEDEVTRQQQSIWRKMLANEMMGYTQTNGQIFCPLTYITADFNTLGSLFVASHIKGFSDPNTTNEEKYDINNGLLLSANADALFDKHLISINENKELVFSFLLDGDVRLKSQLLLMQPIFIPILNEKRMEYLKYHYNIFLNKEESRKIS